MYDWEIFIVTKLLIYQDSLMYIFRTICSNNLSFSLYIDPKMNFSPRPFVNWHQVTENYGLGRRTWWSDVRNNLGIFEFWHYIKITFNKKRSLSFSVRDSPLIVLYELRAEFFAILHRKVHWSTITSIQSMKVFIGDVMQGRFFSTGIRKVTEETFLACALLTGRCTK